MNSEFPQQARRRRGPWLGAASEAVPGPDGCQTLPATVKAWHVAAGPSAESVEQPH